jgi:Zn-dependent protease
MTDFPGFADYQKPEAGEQFFPPKPALNKPADALSRSIMSLLFFALAGYYFFGKDLSMLGIVIVVIFIHEMGHFLAMKIFRYSDVKMFFVPLFGAYVTGIKREISQRQRAIIILAGPVPGIVIGAICYLFGMDQENNLLLKTGSSFLLLNVFNLLPVTPLDGGNLISILLVSIVS